VIIAVPDSIKNSKGRPKIEALSQFARKAACLSALNLGAKNILFEKDASGVPQPHHGFYWSVTHKPDYVAGVVSRKPVGIDIERIKPVTDALFQKIVHPDEKKQFKHKDDCSKKKQFFRAFTAKEAVLKKTGVGIKGLSRTKIKTVIDKTHLIVKFEDENFLVEHFYLDDHIASVTKDLFDVQWRVE